MKVLMFGWEFPPHISGGLGTACFGLTKSLKELGVKVYFVVPRLLGGETEKNAVLINASAARRAANEAQRPAKNTDTSSRSMKAVLDTGVGRGKGITYIDVPAGLMAYGQVGYEGQSVRHETLSRWNYQMRQHHPFDSPGSKPALETDLLAENDSVEQEHNFSGLYGANLFDEVKRYASVAGAITEKYTFDVIHAHDWMTFPAGISAKRKSGKPLVVHVHSTELDRAGGNINQIIFDIEKVAFEEADKIISVSNWTKKILTAHYGVPEDKIEVVHNGILPREQPGDFDFPEIGSHFVTFLGRVTHQKGPGFFVEAAQKVLQEFPEAHFIVAGAGDLLPQIIERVAALNMSTSFHFTGFLTGDQVDQVWSISDVYVMPSVSEPFGIAPLEAIQGNVPVILSNQSGVSEVMPHAIKVDFWDTRALAAAICSVLRYESLSHVLRQNSKQHIKRLTWDKAASDVKALYHELTRRK
jgi:glycogen synthase